MKSKNLRWFLIFLGCLSVPACVDSQVFVDSPGGLNPGFVGALGGETSDDTDGSTDPNDGLDPAAEPDPFPAPFPEPRQDSGGVSLAGTEEPSIFSTQVGEGYNPRPLQIICEIAISLDLVHSGGEHDVPCPIPGDATVTTPPRAELRSVNLGEDFVQSYDAACVEKNPAHAYWSFDIYIEKFFFTVMDGAPQETYPQNFELELFYSIDGSWESVAIYPLEVDCKEWKVHPTKDPL